MTAGRRVAYEEEICATLEDAIDEWRRAILERDVPDHFFTPSYVLPDEAVTKLATLQLPLSRLNISNFLTPQWIWWPKYGEELMDMMLAVHLPDGTAQPDVEMEVISRDDSIASLRTTTCQRTSLLMLAWRRLLGRHPVQTRPSSLVAEAPHSGVRLL